MKLAPKRPQNFDEHPDVPAGNRREALLDTSTLPQSPPFPAPIIPLRVFAARDKRLDRISLQPSTGRSAVPAPLRRGDVNLHRQWRLQRQ